MKESRNITTLFLDIGGVLLTKGWGHKSRKLASEKFHLNRDEMEARHAMAFETFELGKLTMEEYLNMTVFYEPRDFSKNEFRQFTFSQSQPFTEMIELFKRLKKRYKLKMVAVSNEARELNTYRIKEYRLTELIDFFVSSTYVHLRKPDVNIYKLALDMAQAQPQETLCIDDVGVFVKVAAGLGIHGIFHSNDETTCKELNALGFETEL
ncbi:MAG: HAD-IA family hydrolase [Bacteroidetes bacterium]|nr:HAD-IA family hydrolase [Bacteroidota bacterium]MBU1372673.1 HAD-IA family hydrolase [Bacteroidota bacterium]MBU1484869.1 HAD-IA family hydrolase [Bacteroidota bacterium]MBU1761566.1 HAD-IA family hydrolase [Bacteroidota bacterium]MBU2046404.1 HAD-IA family hydrolase [Bacteroidota bacterium]